MQWKEQEMLLKQVYLTQMQLKTSLHSTMTNKIQRKLDKQLH